MLQMVRPAGQHGGQQSPEMPAPDAAMIRQRWKHCGQASETGS